MTMIKQSLFSGMGPNGEQLINVITPGSDFVKTAGVHPEIQAFKQNLSPEPNKTYLHILALGAGEYYGCNLNNDYFPWEGLAHDHTKIPHKYVHGYKTFLNAHAFAHHQNNDPTKAYGDVLVSVINEKMKRVELIAVVDHAKCRALGGEKILEKLIEGKDMATSMGCRIPYDTCMICGNNAPTRKEYCECMLKRAGQILPDGRKVCVTNPFPRFFDISFVYIGADRTSHVLEKIATVVDMGANTHKQAAFLPAVKSFFSGMDPTGYGGSWQLKKQMDADDKQKALNRFAHTAGGAVSGAIAVPVLTSSVEKGIIGAATSPNRLSGFGAGLVRGAKRPFDVAFNISAASGALKRLSDPSSIPANITPAELDSIRKVTGVDIPTYLNEASLKRYSGAGLSLEDVATGIIPNLRQGTELEQGAKIINALPEAAKLVPNTLDTLLNPMVSAALPAEAELVNSLRGKGRNVADLARKFVASKAVKGVATVGIGGILGGLAAYNALAPKTAGYKKAVAEKLSEIFKEVDGYPLGQAVNLMEGCEQDIPDSMLDEMAQMPHLPPVLNSLGRSGIVLSPREFTRIIIIKSSPMSSVSGRIEPFETDGVDSDFLQSMSHVYPDRLDFGGVSDMRSYALPMFLRRLMSPMKMASKRESIKVAMPDIASMYNAYRYGSLLNMDKYLGMHPAMLTEEHTPIVAALVSIPLIYMLKSHWDKQLCEDKEFLERFVESSPCTAHALASVGMKMGVDSLLSKFPSEKIMSWRV
jgi:hypothetical protein